MMDRVIKHIIVLDQKGFKHLGHEYQRENSIDNYDQIDSLSYLLNPYLKYLKFGHSVATDNASSWIDWIEKPGRNDSYN